MTDALLHVGLLAAVAAWAFLAPRTRLGWLFGLWWIGLLVTRILPGWVPEIVGLELPGEGPPPIVELMLAVGSAVQIRALIGLTAWERPRGRKTWIFAALFALGLFLNFTQVQTTGIFLAIPWLWSFRWRHRLSAGQIVLVNLGMIASLAFEVLQFTPWPLDAARFPRLLRLYRFANVAVILYSMLAIFATASRVHLSIERIRLRLLGSHLLAGLVPFVLAVLFLLLSGALHLSTYRGSIGARSLLQASRQAEERIRRELDPADPSGIQPFGERGRGAIVLSRVGAGEVVARGDSARFAAASLLEEKEPSSRTPLLWDGNRLFLRARVDTLIDRVPLVVEALAPVDSLWMVEVSEVVGTPVRVIPSVRVKTAGGGVQIGDSAEDTLDAAAIGPRKEGRAALPGGAIVSLLRPTATGWQKVTVPITSSAGFAEPLLALFTIARENPIATVALVILGILAIFFLGAIWITVTIVTQMSQSITRVVDRLTRAAAALGQGQLSHRIPIEGKDELWSVASSFNHMAEGLERMRSVERETQRLEEELRLAREIQQRLLPAEPPACEHLELAGVSLPARHVGGDYFDYLVLDRGLVGITVADVSGKGAPAALLMSSFRASFRTQDLANLGPAEVLGRLNRFVHASVDPGKFITAFICLVDPETGELRYANAGHDPPLLVRPDGSIEELTGGGLILGMLPQIAYEEARTLLEPGSLVVVYTDGVTEAQDPQGDFFGPERLHATLRAIRSQSCATGVERIVEELRTFSGTSAQFDDITMVLARRR